MRASTWSCKIRNGRPSGLRKIINISEISWRIFEKMKTFKYFMSWNEKWRAQGVLHTPRDLHFSFFISLWSARCTLARQTKENHENHSNIIDFHVAKRKMEVSRRLAHLSGPSFFVFYFASTTHACLPNNGKPRKSDNLNENLRTYTKTI